MIFEDLEKGCTASELGKEYLLFISKVMKNTSFPPKNYYLNFELERLNFTSFGALKNIRPVEENMLIMINVVIRNVIFLNIMDCWKYHPIQSATELLFLIQRNSLIIGSVLQHFITEYYAEKTRIWNFDQTKLTPDLRVYSVPYLENDEDKDDALKQPDDVLVADLLSGLKASKYLIKMKKNNAKLYTALEKKMVAFGDNIRDGVDLIIEQELPPKERMIDKIKYYLEQKQLHKFAQGRK